MIKSFRGLIASGTQDTIVLHTNDGSMGYRIKRLNIIGQDSVVYIGINILSHFLQFILLSFHRLNISKILLRLELKVSYN